MPKRMDSAVAERVETTLPHTPIALVMPHNNARNQIIAPLLTQPDTAYYALTSADQDYLTLSKNLAAALTEQGYTVGAVNSDERSAGRAIGAALKKARTLVLDQFDYVDAAAPAEWIAGLLDMLPSGTQLVLNARHIDTSHWQTLLDNGVVSLIGQPQNRPGITSNEAAQLEIFALGNGAVWYEGRLITRWDGPLTRRLFYYLLDRGPVSRRQIFETFWPNLPTREATNVFHVTKRKMNETIGCDTTDYSERHYHLGNGIALFYDVALFEQTLKAVENADEPEAIDAWERAVRLYRQPFLALENTPWIVARRQELCDKYVGALVNLARAYHARKQDDLALMYYLRAIREAPVREDLYAQSMTIYAELGDKTTAGALYETLRTRLMEQLKIAPARETTKLFNKISR